ncbi:MAG: SDR family oxidoreductase [Melioribacteraceae bacterium]|nr:SDR family oxidoreductase [Melioribacteraceae bacterium]
MSKVLDMFSLKNKVAVITGGAGLLGKKHAEALAEFGCITILADIDEKKGQEAAEQIKNEFKVDSVFYKCDITKKEEIVSLKNFIISTFGRIDILINNAAIDPKFDNSKSYTSFSRLEYFDVEQWNKELTVGLTGAFLCSQIFGFEMAINKGGVIINISSDLGIISPDQRLYRKEGLPESQQPVKPVTYSVIKHGLIGLTKYLATYWAEKGVRANTLCPAGVYTSQSGEFVKHISELIPMGRMAKIDEYKAAIVFLASDASSYMNGATVVIDGGRSII